MSFVFYFGGYSPLGGIETFARDFLLELGDRLGPREMVSWGLPISSHPQLREIRDSGVRMNHSIWRWGCRWNWPDWRILPAGLSAVKRADYVLFGKNFPTPIQQKLRRAADSTGRRIPFVLVTPYRPKEMWGERPDLQMLNTFDAMVVQARSFEQDLRQGGYKGRIVLGSYFPAEPPGVVTPIPAAEAAIRIGFLGRLEAQKNLEYLLESFALLIREIDPRQDYELHIYGEGSLREILEKRSAALKLNSQVQFHGVVRGEQKRAAVENAHFFVNSSTTEGQPLASLEIVGSGRPLLATPVGCHPEMLQEQKMGALGPLNDVRGYATAMRDAAWKVKSGQWRAEQIRAEYDIHYGREKILSQYIDLFKELQRERATSVA